MHDPLTPVERRVYRFLVDYLAEHTYQPSVREIGRRARLRSTKSVVDVLASLETKGFVEREPGRSRGVKIIGLSSIGGIQPVPLYARVNPVTPYLTTENRERFLAVDRALLPADDAFFLRVVGNEMSSRGVFDGDLVLVCPSARAKDEDLVVARTGPHVVVRAVLHLGAVVSLSTGSDRSDETFLGPSDDFAILGVVGLVLRAAHMAPPEDADD